MLISIEGVPVPKSSRTKPKLLVRGKRRRVLRRVVQSMLALQNLDFAESRRGAKYQYTPFIATGTGQSQTTRAFSSTLLALQGGLAAKA